MTWRERIQAALVRGKFTFQDSMDASQWMSCAVGEQHALHPEIVRYHSDLQAPVDSILGSLGSDLGEDMYGFARAVSRDDFDRAERLLDAIEDRALQLKRETP